MPMSVFLRTSWVLSMPEVCPTDADNVKESRFMLPHVKAQLHGVGADFCWSACKNGLGTWFLG